MLEKMYLDDISDLRSEGKYSEKVESKKLDFLFYWVALTNNKWRIAFFTALATGIAIFYSLVATPIYAATATLLLESQKANIISIEDLVSSEQESLDYYGTQFAVLRSRVLAERVLRKLEAEQSVPQYQVEEAPPSTVHRLAGKLTGLFGSDADNDNTSSSATVADGLGKKGSIERAEHDEALEFNEKLNQFRKMLRINPVAKTKLVTVIYESADPEFSAVAANAIANEYIGSVLEQRKRLRDEASQWMDGRIKELKLKLEDSEGALLSFRRTNGLVDLNGNVGRLSDQQLLFTNSELATAKNELLNAREMYQKIERFESTSPELLETLPFVQSDLIIRSVKTEIGQAQRGLVELRNRYGDKHPAIIDAQSSLQSLRLSLAGHIERAVDTFENDYQLLQQRVLSLEANIASGKENIQAIGQQKITMEALEREVSANRDQYNRLFDRITEIRTTDGLDDANAVVAEKAWVPLHPIKPNKVFIVGLAFLGSLLLSAAASFLFEYLDDTVNSTEDVERRLKSKLLGVFPLLDRGFLQRRNDLPLTPSDVFETSEIYLEAVNTCRTALSLGGKSDLQVVLVTSSVPSEGKSTVALNLAHSFGQLERTLLIDCDLRRPSVAKALGMPMDDIGLSSVLLRTSSLGNAIKPNVMGSFDCLTSGPIPDQPLEMLASGRFAKAMEIVRKRYDKIIIDSAPTHVVSDALVLSKLSDSVLYVVKPHETPIKLVGSGLTRLAEVRSSTGGAGASVAGICISQVDLNKSKSYGGLEFHGFGIDYNGYGSYYKYGLQPEKNA